MSEYQHIYTEANEEKRRARQKSGYVSYGRVHDDSAAAIKNQVAITRRRFGDERGFQYIQDCIGVYERSEMSLRDELAWVLKWNHLGIYGPMPSRDMVDRIRDKIHDTQEELRFWRACARQY